MRLRTTLASMVLCLLTACGSGDGDGAKDTNTAKRDYDPTVVTNFMSSCVANAKKTAGAAGQGVDFASVCQCTLDKLEAKWTQAQFLEFEQKFARGGAAEERQAFEQDARECALARR